MDPRFSRDVIRALATAPRIIAALLLLALVALALLAAWSWR